MSECNVCKLEILAGERGLDAVGPLPARHSSALTCVDRLQRALSESTVKVAEWKEAWWHQRDVTADVAFGRLTVAGRPSHQGSKGS
jgi:hypothetical protein